MPKRNHKGPVKSDLKKEIQQIFRKYKNKNFNYREVSGRLGITDARGREAVLQMLAIMYRDGFLMSESPGVYRLSIVTKQLTGTLEITSKGYGFVVSEEAGDDVFIPENKLGTALDGDLVRVQIQDFKGRRKQEGEVVEVLERKRDTFVGTLHAYGNQWVFNPDSKDLPDDIKVVNSDKIKPQQGVKAVLKVTQWHDQFTQLAGEIVEILGSPGDNETEMQSILAEFGFPLRFSEEAIKQAERVGIAIPASELSKRRDMRDILTFTIDPVDAKDFDDAISFRSISEDEVEIGVHIADVSHYLEEGSVLDREAFQRATSVYLIDRVLPMLPENLSNLVCSLRPDEEKLCFSAIFIMDKQAQIRNSWFGRTVIRSRRRYTYEEVEAILISGSGDFSQELHIVNDIAVKLRDKRFAAGSIRFESREIRFRLDEAKIPVEAIVKPHLQAHSLIEELMLLANKEVAFFLTTTEKGKYASSSVFRIHDAPDPEKLRQLADFVSLFNLEIRVNSRPALVKSLNALVEQIQEHPEKNVIESMAIRAMAKAIYSTRNIGHYGLAFTHYTHFTSPIRRYPDVMVHRLLAKALAHDKPENGQDLEMKCRHISDMEKKAAMSERASVKYKQIEMLETRKDEIFDAIITDIRDNGMFVELLWNYCEGMIRFSSIEDDQFYFDSREFRAIGKRWGTVLNLGQEIKVKIQKTNKMTRQVDFILVSEESLRKGKYGNR